MDLPCNLELERAIISAAFVDPNYVFVEAPLDPGVFRDKDNGMIWEAMVSLWNNDVNVTPLTVEDELIRLGKWGDGDWKKNSRRLAEFTVDYESPYSAPRMAETLRDLQRRRELVLIAGAVTKNAYDMSTPVTDIRAKLEKAVEGSVEESKDMSSGNMLMDIIIQGAVQPAERGRERIFTGISGIDSTFLGLEDGRFWVGAAVPNTGKSIFTVAVARGVISQPSPAGVLYIHPEQSGIELSNVMLSSGTRNMRPVRIKLAQLTRDRRMEYAAMLTSKDATTTQQIFGRDFVMSNFTADLKDDEHKQLIASRKPLRWPIEYLDPGTKTIFTLRQRMRAMRAKLTREHGEDAFLLVVVDGLHLLSGAGEASRVQELTTITRELKVAASNDITPGAIIANHQLNYQFYQGDMSMQNNRRYTLRGLRDSGTIGQDADVVYFLDRQTVFNQDNSNNMNPLPVWDPFTMFVKKNRQTSALFSSKYTLNTATLQVKDLEEPWAS